MLKNLIDGKPLPRQRVLDQGTEIGDAWEAAHSNGITYRDSKPGNIFVMNRAHARVEQRRKEAGARTSQQPVAVAAQEHMTSPRNGVA